MKQDHTVGPGQRRGWRRYIGRKRSLLLMLLITVVATAWYLRKENILDPTFIQGAIRDHPVGAPIVFILLYGLAMLSALPTLPVNLAAGFFWGPVLGGIFSTSGATLGAIGAFAAARTIFGQPLAHRFGGRLIGEIQREFQARGWLFVAFMRVNPVFPTGPLNYILGLTAIDTFTYMWVTFAFILPPSIAVAWIGHALGNFVVAGEIAEAVKSMLAVSAAVTVLAMIGYAARLLYKLDGGQPSKKPQR